MFLRRKGWCHVSQAAIFCRLLFRKFKIKEVRIKVNGFYIAQNLQEKKIVKTTHDFTVVSKLQSCQSWAARQLHNLKMHGHVRFIRIQFRMPNNFDRGDSKESKRREFSRSNFALRLYIGFSLFRSLYHCVISKMWAVFCIVNLRNKPRNSHLRFTSSRLGKGKLCYENFLVIRPIIPKATLFFR